MEADYVRKKLRRKVDHLTYHCDGGVEWFSFPILDQFDFIVNGYSTRVGGVSTGDVGQMNLSLAREVAMHMEASEEESRAKVRENHERLASAIGYTTDALIFSNQTHTDNIRIMQDIDRGNGFTKPNEYHDTDGMMTDITGQALMTFYADCVPLLIVDPVHKAIANVHSGWRGTIKGIGAKAVRMMHEVYGSDPSKMVAAIGPSICMDCFEVSKDVAEKFLDKYDASVSKKMVREGRLTETGEQKYHVDLQLACMENFLEAGLKKQNVSVPDLCTSCNMEYLFSHRASRGRRGNQAAVLMLR
ncbi:MAG: peptidoglycan editing factor PgeF [Lachnospiraceae bacterium]|nr:peptidoglycan editing factor PgeF [Lachnospiraceae bacterium]